MNHSSLLRIKISFSQPSVAGLAFALVFFCPAARAAERVGERDSVVLENPRVRLVADLRGGSVGDFRLQGSQLNPLNWSSPPPGDGAIRGFGHFLCLDRWGPPSDAEGAKGMPYHGEAANVQWRLVHDAAAHDGVIEAQMSAVLPKAGLSVRRTIRLSQNTAVFAVREEITNDNPLGRIYNVVQHPTVSPPFLDETTVVDCSGRKGFAQGGALPNPEEPSCFWPQALNSDGELVNMRRLTNSSNPSVVSYTMDGVYGWVTAATPARGLLIGYVWLTSDYPWVSLWRDVHDGRPAARGLEFGSTGLHQPFPILVKKGRIWDRQLFEYLDTGETAVKSYTAFLLTIPPDFAGVEAIDVQQGSFIVRERPGPNRRQFTIDADALIPK